MLSEPSLILTIAIVKWPFYALAGAFLRTRAIGEGLSLVPRGWQGPVSFGLLRCLLGVGASLAAFALLTGPETGAPLLWPVQVGVVRVGVWALTLVVLFPGSHKKPTWVAGWALAGTVYSYLLDLPALTTAFSIGTLTVTDLIMRMP